MKPKVARQKGAATEEMFCEYLRGFGIPAERRHLAGQYDRVILPVGILIWGLFVLRLSLLLF